MNQDDIIKMARQAGASPDGRLWLMYSKDLELFAKLVAAKERDKLLLLSIKAHDVDGHCSIVLAADIRARGEA